MSQPAHYDMAGIRDTTAIPTEGAQPLCTTTPVTIPSSVTATTTCEKMLKESGPWEGTEPCNAGHKGDNTACTDIFEHQSFNPNGISAYHPQPAGISPSKKVTSTVLSISIIGKSTVALIPKHPLQESSHLFSTSKLETSSSPRMVPCPSVPIVQEVLPSHLPVAQPELASETLSYLESASMMSGTLGSLSGLVEDGSSLGSDSEVGFELRRVDKYGFLGGAQYSEDSMGTIRAKVSRQREIKWLEMFNNWDKWASQRFQKVKVRCRKGIPSSLRAKAWQLLSNSRELLDSNPGKFEALERELGDPKWLDVIEKDLHRQFPFHEMFAARGGHGQQDLYRILKAYTVYRPQEGYCQAQAPVAAVLLMHMPAEQAFWCLVQICEVYLPGYYSAGLEAVQLDGEILFSLLRRFCPIAYRHLRKFKIDPILYMTEWFMCIFSRSLPWACVLRVWDMFFCEGVKIIFRVGLVLLKQILGSVDKLQKMQGMYETLECLKKLPLEAIREELLVQEVISVAVTEALIERECRLHVQKWRESRGELFLNPDRRLHGTRAIYEQKQRLTFNTPRSTFSFLGVSDSTHGLTVAPSSLLSLPSFFRSKSLIRIPERNGSFTGTETHTNQNLSVLSESNLGVYDRSKEMSTDKPSHTLAQQPPHRLTLSSPHQQSLTTLGRPAEVSACVPSSAAHSSIPLDASATERGAKKKWEKKEEKLKVREHKAEDKVEKIKQVKEWANKQKPKANVQMGDQQKQEPG